MAAVRFAFTVIVVVVVLTVPHIPLVTTQKKYEVVVRLPGSYVSMALPVETPFLYHI